jgi:hypothetical protein
MIVRNPLAIFFAIAAGALATSCGVGPDEILQQARLRGDSGTLAGVQVDTWATLGAGGRVERVGLTLPGSAVEAALEPQELVLALPEEVRRATFLDHLQVDYQISDEAQVGVYKGGQFEFRFFGIDHIARAQINCVNEPMPTSTTLPEPYLVPGTGLAPEGSCVPGVGVHAYDPTAPGVDPSSSVPFTSTLGLGYHKAALAFVEGIAADSLLDNQKDFALPIPALELLGRSTLFPGAVIGQYSADEDAYLVYVEAFAPDA